MKTLENKIALVTGAAQGIGAATARILAEKGAIVILTDVKEELGQQTVAGIENAEFLKLDVSQKTEVDAVVKAIIAKHGRLDLAVNNAGIGGVLSPLHEVKIEDWDKMMLINLTGQLFCLQAEIKAMLRNGGGSIVNVSSLAGGNGVAMASPYSVSKHGLIGLTKSAAREYGALNIRINAVCPSWTETAILEGVPDKVLDFSKRYLTPMRRLGQAHEIGQSIAYLLSDEASYITGTTLYLDGGMEA